MQRRDWMKGLTAVGLAAAWAGSGALAQETFPNRPVRLVVPYAAGGGTDIMARLIATEMGKALGQPVVVDNRAGAGGSLGADHVAKSAADGYTILMATASTHAINPEVYAKLAYDPVKNFTPLTMVATIPGVVVVNSKSRFTNLKGLVEEMRANPGKLTFGSQGQGGLSHLMGEMLNSQAKVQSVHIPYRGGAQALQDVIAGNVDILYDTLPAVLPHLKSGALRAIAITAPERSNILPDLPTSAEQGYPQFVAQTWNALFAPAPLAAPVRDRLTAAAIKATKDAEVQKRILAMSAEPIGSDGKTLGDLVARDRQRWSQAVKASGISLD